MRIFQKAEHLHVTIQDNGKGFNKEKSDDMQKSLGMSITQKRLQYINDHAEGNYNLQTQSDENGTVIHIQIKLV